MEGKYILRIEQPWIKCYTSHAHLLSILQCDEKTYCWIFSNFLNLYMNKDIKKNDWGEFYRPLPYETRIFDSCKWLNIQKIRRELVVGSKEKLLQFVSNELKDGYYVHLAIEHKYITSFATNNHWHDALVYGIDIENNMVYLQDVFIHGHYERRTISIDEFADAVMLCRVPEDDIDYMNNSIYSYKIKENCDYVYDVENIKHFVQQYYDETIPEYWVLYNFDDSKNIEYGMGIYKALCNYIRELDLSVDEITFRPFYLLKDHFLIMQKLFEWLKENEKYNPTDIDKVTKQYDAILSVADTANFLLILMNKTKKDKKREALEYINQMCEMEKALRPDIQNILST